MTILQITMKSAPLLVESVLRKTSSEFFKTLKKGDTITLKTEVKCGGSMDVRKRIRSEYKFTKSAYITVTNEQTGKQVLKSFSQMGTLLECFKFSEIR